MAQAEILEWIDDAQPEQMHCVVLEWYWDYGSEIPRKIIDQRRCNVSTAIEVFFAIVAGGVYNSESRNLYPDTYDILVAVSERLRLNFYSKPAFSVGYMTEDFLKDARRLESLKEYGPGSFWNLPLWAFEMPVDGLKIDCSGYLEGNPPELEW